MTLINLSNHPSDKWSDKQKEGWDKVIDVPFPQIPASASEEEVINNFVTPISNQLAKIANEIGGNEFNIMLMGEQFFCDVMKQVLKENFNNDIWHFYYTTTERKVVEKQKEDGTVEKTAIFEFVRWRTICNSFKLLKEDEDEDEER